jgi:DNA-directed RNA polymerase subunit RPC12/RpoP
MPDVQRSSDIAEGHASEALIYGVCGLLALGLGGLCFAYKGMLMYAGIVMMLGGAGAIGFAIKKFTQIKRVTSVGVTCPYCKAHNELLAEPTESFSCVECHRLIPVFNNEIQEVFQVRCGFCNHLNYYNPQSVGLICEECDREIPIATADGRLATKSFHAFSRHDDDRAYDLILTEEGPKHEEMITCLQHMLALNRNQVKQILEELPSTLLTGIPKMKADMLSAQISTHGGAASVSESAQQ